GCQVRQHLVHVHVRRGARTGLVHVDRELPVVLAGDDLVGGLGDRVGDVAVESAEVLVRERRRLLDAGERGDLRGLEAHARDREVLHRTLGLSAVQRVHGYTHFTHGVVLDAVLLLGVAAALGCVGHFCSFAREGMSVSGRPTWATGTAVPSVRRYLAPTMARRPSATAVLIISDDSMSPVMVLRRCSRPTCSGSMS